MVMKKLLVLVLLVSGCGAGQDQAPAIAVAESFVFAKIEDSDRRGTPPPRQKLASGSVVFPAPCPLPPGQPKKRKGLFRAKRNRNH